MSTVTTLGQPIQIGSPAGLLVIIPHSWPMPCLPQAQEKLLCEKRGKPFQYSRQYFMHINSHTAVFTHFLGQGKILRSARDPKNILKILVLAAPWYWGSEK